VKKPVWIVDEYGTLMLHFVGPHGPVEAWIGPRPQYCDRGHWQFGVMYGVPSLDGADSFPRYYMSLKTAIKEANAWLNWRLYKVTEEELPTQLQQDPDNGGIWGERQLVNVNLEFEPAGKYEIEEKV